MTTINQESWNDREDQFENSNSRVQDTRLPNGDYNLDDDEDDQNLSDDDVNGRDLDTDNGDEWDEDDVSETDLDEDDLADNDEANADLHSVKNDKFGSLASPVQNGPDPDEIPEEHEADESELDYPDDDTLEEGSNNEVNYNEPTEVTQPAPEPDTAAATIDNLDPTFVDDSHERQSKRIVDHEPGAGSTTGDHGAYNL